MIAILNSWKGWLIFLALGFSSGWQVHSWKVGAAEGQSIKQGLKVAQELNVKADKIVETKIEQEQAIKIVYRTIRERVKDVQDDRVCFTGESLSLWNDAIAGADQNRSEPAREAGETPAPPAKEATVTEILDNAAMNYEICNSNSVKHNALIDEVNSLKGGMCVCN